MIFRDIFYNRVATITMLVCCIWLLVNLMPVLVPFIVAFVLAYLLNPLVKWLGNIGVSRVFAIVLVFFIASVVLSMAVAYLIPLLIDQFEVAKNNMPVFLEWLNNDARPWVSEKIRYEIPPFNSSEISDELLKYLQTNYNVSDARSIISTIATSGLSAISSVGLFVLVPVVAFFFMLSWEANMKGLRALVPPRMQSNTFSITTECHEVMMAFVKGQMLVMFILGVVYALGLQFVVGLDTGFIIGMVAGLASVVPYLGPIVGVASAVVATIVQFGFDLTHLGLMTGVFVVGQVLEGYFLQPKLLGDRIGLSPTMVILVVLVGGNLLGLVGMLIALPLAAVIMVLVRKLVQSYKESDFYNRNAVITNHKGEQCEVPDDWHAQLSQLDVQQPLVKQQQNNSDQPKWMTKVKLNTKKVSDSEK